MLKTSIILFAVCYLSAVLHTDAKCQAPPGKDSLRGTVLDSATRKPVPYATVMILDDHDAALKSVIGGSDGSFAIPAMAASRQKIAFTALGYKPKQITVNLSDPAATVSMGPILLRFSSTTLKAVEVEARKPLIKQEIDGISYDIQADPDSKVNSLLEMMRKVPLLSLDADDNIQLKGSSSYKILINGKPSSMTERNPREVLRSMPASTIQRIEVITIPPAKYDAEGLVGIINIITSKKIANGYTGTVNISERFPAGGPGMGGSFDLKLGKLGISAYGGGSISRVPQTLASISRNTFEGIPNTLQQDNLTTNKNRNGYLGLEISYEIDSLNLISTQMNINGGHTEESLQQRSLLADHSGVLQQYSLLNNNTGNGSGKDVAVNYERRFKKNKNQLLTFSYRYYTYGNDNHSNISLWDQVAYPLPDYRQINEANFSENTFQADYVHLIKKINLNIEAGIKGILRDNSSNFQYQAFDDTQGKYRVDSSKSNLFNNTQNVLAFYNSYQLNIKDWGFRAGIRLEGTYIKGEFISGNTKVKQDFLNAIPSIAISRKFKNSTSLNLGFTQRIQRPGIYQLNPFVDRSNPNIEITGNPDLRPITGNVIQAGYSISRKVFLNFGADYTFFKTLINQVSVFDPETNITRITYQNTGRASLIGANASMNCPISKGWDLSINTKAAYGKVDGVSGTEPIETSGIMYALFASSSYGFGGGWRASASCSVNGKGISLQKETNGYTSTSFSLSKQLLKNKLTCAVSVNNPFNKYRNVITDITGPNFLQRNTNENYFRNFNVRLNCNFGKLKKETIQKNKRGIKNDDISN
ncbi:outer membrane beta-barrel protein [uncultured Chitinophaga sp.]|jgi:hypothetical protein|uniref:outer membrane beta-barrel protein n=1 Tax=uncultured Chitinophaga sp. TaxID=339340 RepID=UPI00262F1010|nr:outer membrane beta-barrel protein [uncultured Chitinophaga sp.]